MYKNLLFLISIVIISTSNAQSVWGDVNIICSNQNISTGAPVQTEFDDIITSCGTIFGESYPLTTYLEFYQIIIESGTTFTFTITPNANVDYDFASWLNPDLSNLGTPDRASQNNPILTGEFSIGLSLTELYQLCEAPGEEGNPEPGFVRYYDVVPGDIILIAVDRWQDTDAGYTISFGGDAQLSCSLLFNKCDEDKDGQEGFNLNEIRTEVQQQYPDYNIKFYDTQLNAQSGTNQGLLTGNFIAQQNNNPNTIYARLETSDGNFVDVIDLSFIIFPIPDLNPPVTLFYCTASGGSIGLFDLTQAISALTDDAAELEIRYYTSLENAEVGGNSGLIPYPTNYTSAAGTIYVRFDNPYNCHAIQHVNLEISQMHLVAQNLDLGIICMEENSEMIDLNEFREDLTDEDFLSYQYQYYLNQSDAQSGNTANAITDPQNFPVTSGTTYSIFVRIKMGINCAPIISSITFKVDLIPSITLESPQNVCSGDSLTLTAQTQSGLTVNWYDAQLSTTPIFTGINFITPNLTQTTNYWLEAVSIEGCTSERILVEIIVNELPTFTINPSIEICINSSAELSVETDAENEVYWYDSQNGTTPIHVGNPFTTPNLNATTSYWTEVKSEEDCTSERQEIMVEIMDSVTPTFDLELQFCIGNEFIELPIESENGITGTWNPAEIDTSVLGFQNFIFTPDSGQCTDEFPLEIEITDSIEPLFDLDFEYCQSDELIDLPTTSNNGITGIWMPAQIDISIVGIQNFTFTPNENQCAESIPFSVEIFETQVAEFDLIPEYCLGLIPQALENISDNGISGTWLPTYIDTNTVGTQIYTFTPEGICGEDFILEVTILDEITPTFDFPIQYCLNSGEIILPTQSDNNVSGTWFPTTINTDNLGTEIYTFTPHLECAIPITKEITIVEIITPEFDLTQNYCLGTDAEMLPTISDNGITGTWNQSQINTNIQGITIYTFTPNDGQCGAEYLHTVTVYPHPDMDLEEELLICEGDIFTYSAPDGFDSYLWKNESNQIISETQEVTFIQEGIYTLTVEISGVPCDLSRNIEVRFSTLPTITEVKTTENSITIYATGGNPLEYSMNQVFWQSSPTFTDLQPGIFNVYVRDAKGCSTTAKQTGILGIPNFISPNGDGYNDTWELRGLEVYPNTRLQIFDRFGKIFVDRMIDGDFKWDGRYGGLPLPSGSYWYVLTLESGEKISGNVALKSY